MIMKKLLIFFLFSLWACTCLQAQSLELMAGDKQVFADVQWLKPLDQQFRWSVFSRTRATLDYDNRPNVFTGAYLNYTTKAGLGASLVGKIGNSGGGVDAGLHFFKNRKNWMLFGLASVGLKKAPEYSWFSIFRFTPPLFSDWKLYSSLELYSLFNNSGHIYGVQRVRVGLDKKGWQFGLGGELSEAGNEFQTSSNTGLFFRKSF